MFKKTVILLAASTAMLASSAFAMNNHPAPCREVAAACMHAGYKMGGEKKMFWMDCMKPTIMGQKVKGVMVDPTTVKMCRMHRIDVMKKELAELESVK